MIVLGGGPAEGHAVGWELPGECREVRVLHVWCACSWCDGVEGSRVVHRYEPVGGGRFEYVRSETDGPVSGSLVGVLFTAGGGA